MTTPMREVPRGLPAPTTVANVIRRVLMVAASQIGYHEGRSASGDWNNDNIYGKTFGQNYVAWCNWFVSQIAVSAGVPSVVIPRTGYTPTSWGWMVNHSRNVTTPKAGDLFWVYGFVPAENRNRVHHVGYVEKVLSGNRVQTIEGNTNNSGSSQGDGVYRLVRPINSRLRFARPNYAAAVVIPTPKPPTSKPTPEVDVTPAQMAELKNHVSNVVGEHEKVMRRNFARVLRYGLQTEDERMKANDRYDEVKAAGGTEGQALDAMWQVLAPLDAALAAEQAAI